MRSGEDPQQALIELQQFQARIAVGWQGNSRQRSPHVDPDSYAAEVMLEERARLGLRNHFHQVMEALAQIARTQRQGAEPLFVLPIDDLDLAPEATLELLQLLRMLSVPRLFALVLGDIGITETIINLQMSRRLALAAGGSKPDILSVSSDVLASTAGSLAANLLRKFVPPNQRYALKLLSTREGLNFSPIHSQGAPLRLHELLARYPMHWETDLGSTYGNILTLRDFLLASVKPASREEPELQIVAPGLSAGQEVSEEILNTASYLGQGIVRTSPRRLVDLCFALERESESFGEQPDRESAWNHLRAELAEYASRAVAEDAALPVQERERLIETLRTPTLIWDIGSWAVQADIRSAPATIVPFDQEPQEVAPPGWVRQVEFGRFLEWQLAPSVDGGRPLAANTAAALALYHDLVILKPTNSRLNSPFFPRTMRPPELASMRRQPFQPKLASTKWQPIQDSEPITVTWPLPPFNTFWEWDLFLNTWSQNVQTLTGMTGLEEVQIARLFLVWAGAVATVLTGRGHRDSGDHTPPQVLNDERLDELASRAGRTGQHNRKAREWLIQVALLISPETGIPADFVGQASERLAEFWSWEMVRHEIRERRTSSTRPLYQADPKGWRAILDQLRGGLTADHNPTFAPGDAAQP